MNKKNLFKKNVLLKKVTFVFHTFFKLEFMAQIIYCIIYKYMYPHFILFLFYYISLQETGPRNNMLESDKVFS